MFTKVHLVTLLLVELSWLWNWKFFERVEYEWGFDWVDVESEKEESDVKKERPAIKAVLLIGCWKSHSVSHEKFEFMKNQRLYKPPIPNACGVPLLLFKQSVGSNSNQPTTMLMCDTKSGFAPPEWQANVGECIAFRADGKDYTSTDQGIVHDYIMHLMDEFAEERVGNQVSAYAFQKYIHRCHKDARSSLKLEFVRLKGLKGAAHLNGKKDSESTIHEERALLRPFDHQRSLWSQSIAVTEFKPHEEATFSIEDTTDAAAGGGKEAEISRSRSLGGEK